MSKRFSKWSLGLATLGMILSTSLSSAQDLTIGSKAPKIDIEHWISNGNGKFKPITEFQAGKVYVVEFWATWCGPCIQSMPHLAATQETYADKGVQLISVSDEETEVVDAFLKKQVKGSDKDDTENTYGKLTSAYCLTTDPDKSVNTDYMEAAGQNGIPTCFIVGKSGLIEWIGHPMEMDEPLGKVVEGTWDRDVYLAGFKKEQQLGLLMAKVSRPVQKGDAKAALKVLAQAKEEAAGDESMIASVEDVETRVNVYFAMKKIEDGDAEGALAEIEALSKTAKPTQKPQLAIARSKALLSIVSNSGKKADEAAKALTEVAALKEVDGTMLNELAWTVYEASVEDDKLSKPLIAAAVLVAEKAVAQEPKRGEILDTLAHLVYLQGNLDRAIELQTEAIKNAPAEMKEDLQSFLDEIKKKKASK